MHSHSIAILLTTATLAAAPASWQADREQALRHHVARNYREAERLFGSALAALKEMAPQDPHIPEILNDLGADCHLLGKYAEAEQFYKDALAAWRSRPEPPADSIARALGNLATAYRAHGLYLEAERVYKEALQTIEGDARYSAQFAFTLSSLADLYRALDRCADALPQAQRAVKILEEVGDAATPRLGFALQTLGAIHRVQGRIDEADKLYRKALAISTAQNGSDHPTTATAKSNVADIALKLGNYIEAEVLSREAIATWERTLGRSHTRVGVASANLAQALRFQDRYEEAATHFDRALEILDGADRARCLANYADMDHQQGKLVGAVELYRQALDSARQAFGENHPQTALIMTRLAEVRRGQGQYAESVKLYRRAMPILEAAGAAEKDEMRAKYNATLKESARTMLVR